MLAGYIYKIGFVNSNMFQFTLTVCSQNILREVNNNWLTIKGKINKKYCTCLRRLNQILFNGNTRLCEWKKVPAFNIKFKR